jgi:hypothetical protein
MFSDGAESSWGEDNYSNSGANAPGGRNLSELFDGGVSWGSFDLGDTFSGLGGLFSSKPTPSWSKASFNNAINNIGKVDNSMIGTPYTGPAKVINPNSSSYGWTDFGKDLLGIGVSVATKGNPLATALYGGLSSLVGGGSVKDIARNSINGFTSRGFNNYRHAVRGVTSHVDGTAGDALNGALNALPSGDIGKMIVGGARGAFNSNKSNPYGKYGTPGFGDGFGVTNTGATRNSNSTVVDSNGNSYGNVAGVYNNVGYNTGNETADTLLNLGNQYLQYKQAKKLEKQRAYALQNTPEAVYAREQMALANKQADNNAEFTRQSIAEQKLNNQRNYDLALENNRRQALRYNNAIREKNRYANLLLGNSNSAYAINRAVSRTPYSVY